MEQCCTIISFFNLKVVLLQYVTYKKKRQSYTDTVQCNYSKNTIDKVMCKQSFLY